jgi:hypothetical protein
MGHGLSVLDKVMRHRGHALGTFHTESVYRQPPLEVLFDDLQNILGSLEPVPDPLRIDNNTRPLRAGVETSRLIGAYGTFQAKPMDLPLELVQIGRPPLGGAAPFGVV